MVGLEGPVSLLSLSKQFCHWPALPSLSPTTRIHLLPYSAGHSCVGVVLFQSSSLSHSPKFLLLSLPHFHWLCITLGPAESTCPWSVLRNCPRRNAGSSTHHDLKGRLWLCTNVLFSAGFSTSVLLLLYVIMLYVSGHYPWERPAAHHTHTPRATPKCDSGHCSFLLGGQIAVSWGLIP